MKMKLFALIGMLGLGSLSSFAAIVNYSTVGEYCDAANVCSASFVVGGTANGTLTLTYNNLTNNEVNFPGASTIASFGEIKATCSDFVLPTAELPTSACSGGNPIPAGFYLRITVTHNSPLPSVNGALNPSGTMVGAIAGTSSGLTVAWSPLGVFQGTNTSYSILNSPLGIVPPSVNAGVTSVQALITDTTVPEPSTYAMLGSALLGLGLLRRRKA